MWNRRKWTANSLRKRDNDGWTAGKVGCTIRDFGCAIFLANTKGRSRGKTANLYWGSWAELPVEPAGYVNKLEVTMVASLFVFQQVIKDSSIGSHRRTIRLTLCPPKPNELLITTCTSRFRAVFGT
jgi:hypothetical protein